MKTWAKKMSNHCFTERDPSPGTDVALLSCYTQATLDARKRTIRLPEEERGIY